MILGVYRLFRNYSFSEFEFIYILLLAGITIGLIYGIDFVYRKIKKKEK